MQASVKVAGGGHGDDDDGRRAGDAGGGPSGSRGGRSGSRDGSGARDGSAGAGTASGPGGRRGEGGDLLSELELGAWRGMLRAHAGVTLRLDEELRERHGLSLGAYEVLMLVGTAPRRRMRISELSQETLLSISGMSRMIDRLERDGLAVRESCADDRRGAEVALTVAGRARLRAARATHLGGVRAEFLLRFDDAELALMRDLWERIAPPGA